MTDIDLENLSPNHRPANCENDESCCSETASASFDDNPDSAERIDGGGEPCPTPLMWQEVRENFLSESTRWEIVRGPHHLHGRWLGNGPPLYFLNNFAATAELFALTVCLLKDRFRCVVFDATTDSRKIARQSAPSINDFALDLFAIADHLGDVSFPIYGAGFGATVALQATIQQPERVSHLLLQHGFAKRRLSMFERWLASACLASGQTLDRLPQRRRFQAVNHRPWFPPFDQSRFDFLVDSTGTLLLRDLGRRALAVNSFDAGEAIRMVKCPVTLIRTEGEGRLAAESQAEIEKAIPHSKTEWMHSAGQHPYLTHPHRVAKIVQNALGD